MRAKVIFLATSLAIASLARADDDPRNDDVVGAISSTRQSGSPDVKAERNGDDTPTVKFEAAYKADLLTGLNGPLRGRDAYVGHLELKLTVAGEKAFKLSGGTLFIHGISDHGSKPNARIGANQGIDNIEVSTNTSKILQLWYQQQCAGNRISLLAGLYDLNAEFYVTDSSAIFLHPALGVGTDIAQTGVNGPSIFPTTSVGLRGRIEITNKAYIQAVVLDGVPGDPNQPHGTQIEFRRGDGALWVAESGIHFAHENSAAHGGNFAVGVWGYTRKFDDQTDVDADGNGLKRRNRGMYVIGEYPVYKDASDPTRGLTAFVRYGRAKGEINVFNQAAAVGAVYSGLLASRLEDQLGFTIAYAGTGSKSRAASSAAVSAALKHEIAYELTYRARVNHWLALQPELQFVNRVSDDGTRHASIVGIRIEASY